ncbi:MAG: hypothetical protein NDF55_05590 [archaeon GB-1867-005]|nr:hypothetical protein [Candidatus Culexmicrobium cathedralense]
MSLISVATVGRMALDLSLKVEECIARHVVESTCTRIGVLIHRMCLIAMRSEGFRYARAEITVPKYAGNSPYLIRVDAREGEAPALTVHSPFVTSSFILPEFISDASGEVLSTSSRIVVIMVREGFSLHLLLRGG